MLDKIREVLTGKCKHEKTTAVVHDEEKDELRYVCLLCGEPVDPPTEEFRKLIVLRKHIKLRVGYPTDREGKHVTVDPTFNVGLRYAVPGEPSAVRRVWVTFENKSEQKRFANQLDRRMRFCSSDAGYNEVINEAIDIIRNVQPDLVEQVVERADSSDEA